MQSAQESKQELEAAIRYAENAISSAKTTIESMEFRQEMAKKQSSEQTGREAALEEERAMLEKNVKYLRDENERLERDVTAKTIQAEAWKKEYDKLKEGAPTMPVIPKAVAITIFREGMAYGASNVCDELENSNDIEVSDRERMGNFEVEFQQWVDLSDHLDLDYLRNSVSEFDDSAVIDALGTLCADNEFECRIHGVDDQGEDSKSA